MDANSEGDEEAGAEQLRVSDGEAGIGLRLVGVGDQQVHGQHRCEAGEEGELSPQEADLFHSARQQFEEGDVDHDAGGEAEAERHEGGSGATHEPGDEGAQGGGESGESGEQQREGEVGHGRSPAGRGFRPAWGGPGAETCVIWGAW